MRHKKRRKEERKHINLPKEAYDKRKLDRALRVKRAEDRARKASAEAKERKLKILDDNGVEHQEGEIFESNTLTIEI